MKRRLTSMTAVLLILFNTILFTSCGPTAIEKRVADITQTLPYDTGRGVTLTELSYNNGILRCVCETESILFRAMSFGGQDELKIKFLKNTNIKDPLIQYMINGKATIQYVLINKETKEKISTHIHADEIQKFHHQ